MSASLVGSEMCIRDSPALGPPTRGRLVAGDTVRLTRAARGCLQRTAVSYTHLTLPTICSV
eukprot:2662743-Alexandrium_andersonii.AAC.1